MHKTAFISLNELGPEEKQQVADMAGKILIWCLEGRHIAYMSEQLNLAPDEVEFNIEEMLYIIRKNVGNKKYLQNLLVK